MCQSNPRVQGAPKANPREFDFFDSTFKRLKDTLDNKIMTV